MGMSCDCGCFAFAYEWPLASVIWGNSVLFSPQKSERGVQTKTVSGSEQHLQIVTAISLRQRH